jgi:glycosyltransferase involved in cell wall biosynthesis
MKVLVISSLYTPYHRGGAETVVSTIVKGLQSEGHEVILLTSGPFDGFSSFFPVQEMIDSVTVYRFFPLNIFWFGNIEKKPFWLRFFWRIFDVFNFPTYFVVRAFLEKVKPQLVLSHNLCGMGYTVPRAVASMRKRIGFRYIHTVHDVQLFAPSGLIVYGEEQSWTHQNFFVKVYRFVTRFLFSKCPEVVFPSGFLKDFYERFGFFKKGQKRITRNPLPQNGELVRPVFIETKSSPILNLLFLGQLEPHKGISFLIDVLRKQEVAYTLHIVGAGSLFHSLSEQLKTDSRFIVHGYLSHEALFKFFPIIHATVFPSFVLENCPATIVESLSFGIPVLASCVGGVPEIIEDGKNGFLFQPGDKTTLESCLLRLRKAVEQGKWKDMSEQCFLSSKGLDIEIYLKGLS